MILNDEFWMMNYWMRCAANGEVASHRMGLLILGVCVQFIELRFHRRVAVSELLDGDVLGLIVGEAKLAVGGEEGVPGLLQVNDRLVDFVDCGLKLLAGEFVVAGETSFEGFQFLLKIGLCVRFAGRFVSF